MSSATPEVVTVPETTESTDTVIHILCPRCDGERMVALCGKPLDDAEEHPIGRYPNECIVCVDLEYLHFWCNP